MGAEPIASPPDAEGERSVPVTEKTGNDLGKKLLRAARNGSVPWCRELIEAGADVNAADEHGWTPLFRAVEWEKADIVRLLIERGANVNATVKPGGTPLHLAAFMRNSEIAELLMDAGADVNARDDSGYMALDDAVEFGVTRMESDIRGAMSRHHAQRVKAFKVLRDRKRKE